MINFTRAFDSAWERMHVILFRPFDFGKWCAIGLSAFLAGFLAGGNGFNTSYRQSYKNAFHQHGTVQNPTFDFHQFNATISEPFAGMQAGVVILTVLLIMTFVLILVLVIYWLGARGQFMFLDNVVRNRGAISWPWQYYARQANSVFGFYLLFLLLSLLLLLPIFGVAAVICLPLFREQRWPEGGEIVGLVVLALIYLVVGVVIGVVIFIFREFGIPIMFRQGLLARPAFRESMKLLRQHPGSIVLFVLLRIAIFIGVAILSVIICCATCCIGLLPYIGTVFLLPVLVYVKCFTLDCLAQFGPEYDVWTVDVQPPSTPGEIIPPLSPRHHPDKFDPVPVLEGMPGPLVPRQGLAIEFDQ